MKGRIFRFTPIRVELKLHPCINPIHIIGEINRSKARYHLPIGYEGAGILQRINLKKSF